MSDEFRYTTMGEMLGFLFGMAFVGFIQESGGKHELLKRECEKSLPRDQHCKIIAVPVERTDQSSKAGLDIVRNQE